MAQFSRGQIAREFLGAVAAGADPADLLEQLVRSVLDDDAVRLAMQVCAGGEHQWRHAIELAAILASESVADERTKVGG